MTEQFIRLAPYLKDPLVLIGFFLLLAFLFSRYLVKKRIIQPLPRTLGYRILRSILLYGFILGLFIIVLGYVLKRQELIGQQRTADHLEMLLREATKGAPGSEKERDEVVLNIIDDYRSGKVTKEQVEKIAQDLRISLAQTNNYPPEYRVSRDQSNSGWQQRSHTTLPNSGNGSETKTDSPSLTTTAVETTRGPRDQTDASSRREINSVRPLDRNAVIGRDQTFDVDCLICGCQVTVTSEDLIKRAWDALNSKDPKNLERALACTKVTIAKFADVADEQQTARVQANECKKTPTPQEKGAYFKSYWALSDFGAAWFIRGQVFEQQKNCTEAKEAYQTVIAKYNCAYIWDDRGWYWNAAQGADQALKKLETNGCR